LAQLVRAAKGCYNTSVGMGTPFISGKDSFHNEYKVGDKTVAIPPTLLISAMGIVPNVEKAVTMDAKNAGDLVYVLGVTYNEFGGSHFAAVTDGAQTIEGIATEAAIKDAVTTENAAAGSISDNNAGNDVDNNDSNNRVPRMNNKTALSLYRALHKAMQEGLVASCHDCSDGGIAVAAAETAFAGGFGMRIDANNIPVAASFICESDGFAGEEAPNMAAADTGDSIGGGDTDGGKPAATWQKLFSESNSRFVVTVSPENKEAFEAAMPGSVAPGTNGNVFAEIGMVTADNRFTVAGNGGSEIDTTIDELKEAWISPLRW
jgi:phosphoribosylformylglycinamidine (FGAM) synthase-like enzyme